MQSMYSKMAHFRVNAYSLSINDQSEPISLNLVHACGLKYKKERKKKRKKSQFLAMNNLTKVDMS